MSGATAHRTTITVTRRARALPMDAALWILLCALVVIIVRSLVAQRGIVIREYWSGSIALTGFVLLGWYSVRKRSLRFSLRVLGLTKRLLPAGLQERLVIADRLESWRAVHITLGILVLLPLWWHLSSGPMSSVEMLLALAVALLLLSGIGGVVIQDYLPPAIEMTAEREVRLEDIASRIDAVYVEAEEKVLGHSEAFVQAYVQSLKPILEADRVASRWRLFRATLTRGNVGSETCGEFRKLAAQFADDTAAWNELVDLTVRKVNLEHNAFNLHFSTGWLSFHIVVALCTFALLILHISAVLYFYGL